MKNKYVVGQFCCGEYTVEFFTGKEEAEKWFAEVIEEVEDSRFAFLATIYGSNEEAMKEKAQQVFETPKVAWRGP